LRAKHVDLVHDEGMDEANAEIVVLGFSVSYPYEN